MRNTRMFVSILSLEPEHWTEALQAAGFLVNSLSPTQQSFNDCTELQQALTTEVVLLDAALPNAHELIRILRGAAHPTPCPLLLLNTLADEAGCQALLEAGADDVVASPAEAVRRLRLIQQVRTPVVEHAEQYRLSEALADTAAIINSTLNLNDVLDRVLETVGSVVAHDSANIMRIDGDRAYIVRERHHGAQRAYNQTLDIANLPDMQAVIDTQQPFIIADTRLYPYWSGLEVVNWIRSNLTAPLRIGGEVIGYLCLDSMEPNAFSEHDGEYALAFADQAALAIHNADLYNEMETRVAQRTLELNRERIRLSSVLNALGEGVLYFGTDFTVHYINDMLCKITGYSAEEWHRYPASALLRGVDDAPDGLLQQLLPGDIADPRAELWHGEARLMRKDGSLFDASLISTQVLDDHGVNIGCVVVVRDITREKELERRKEYFVTRASHELRTPIANLKTRLYLMRRQPEQVTKHLQVANEVAGGMEKLIEDLLTISRYGHQEGLINPSKVVLQDVLREVFRVQDPAAELRHITLIAHLPEAPIAVWGSYAQIQRAVTNLVINALHYTDPGGEVELHLSNQVSDGNAPKAVITVRDNGIGIAAEHLPFLFQPFFRLDRNHIPGSGLGLSIVSEIVQLHQGSINVTSESGRGSCFIVYLPLLVTDSVLKPSPQADR